MTQSTFKKSFLIYLQFLTAFEHFKSLESRKLNPEPASYPVRCYEEQFDVFNAALCLKIALKFVGKPFFDHLKHIL